MLYLLAFHLVFVESKYTISYILFLQYATDMNYILKFVCARARHRAPYHKFSKLVHNIIFLPSKFPIRDNSLCKSDLKIPEMLCAATKLQTI